MSHRFAMAILAALAARDAAALERAVTDAKQHADSDPGARAAIEAFMQLAINSRKRRAT